MSVWLHMYSNASAFVLQVPLGLLVRLFDNLLLEGPEASGVIQKLMSRGTDLLPEFRSAVSVPGPFFERPAKHLADKRVYLSTPRHFMQ